MRTHAHDDRRRARIGGNRFVAGLVAVLMGLAGVVGGIAPAAVAAPNPAIKVGVTTLTGPAPGQLTVGDVATLSGTWDATDANPQPGDSFTIGLPAEFDFPEAITFPLVGSDGEGGTISFGTCITDPATSIATCTLSNEVVGRDDISGTWEFDIEAVAATEEKDVVFDLNGALVPVELPGGGGIDSGIVLPGEVTKSGVMNANNWSMTWTLDIPGANLVAAGNQVAHVTDTLGAGHVLCDPIGFTVQTVRGSTVVDVTSIATLDGAPGDTSFAFDLAGPFDANVTYRVTYQTCTPDGQIDPSGTTYDNTAQIQGWGAAGEGVGTVTNKPWAQGIGKSGSVLGGANRDGKIAWQIVVPGSALVGTDTINLVETLGGGHQVCTDGSTISGITVVEQYGPNPGNAPGLRQDITGKLSKTVNSQSTSGFDVTYTIDDPTLVFKPSDWRYIISYTTCVTQADLPNGGTAYENSASVNGTPTSGTATVPGRNEGKNGNINSSIVTLDGVEHMPQTTLNWSITIPGQKIEDIQNELTLTDVLSSSQTVCEAGDPSGGLAARMNLTVQARDQISGGGLATVDLTSDTQVAENGGTLTFTIPAKNLPIPTGTSDGFSREYQYVVTYTTCTTSGGMDAAGTTYSNTVTGGGIEQTKTVTQNNKGSGTGTGVAKGGVAVSKTLADTAGAAFVPAGTAFTVHVKEVDPTGTTQNEYDLSVPLDGTPVKSLNARGTGWTLVLSEPTFPSVPGVTFGTPVFTASPGVVPSEDGTTATATISPRTNVDVSLTNTAQLGSVTLTKSVTGGAAGLVDAAKTYSVTAKINTSSLGANVPAQPDRTFTVTAGTPVTLDKLPIGAVVTFSEVRPTDDDQLTWGTPVFDPATVTVTAQNATTPATVSLTNSVERTRGTFTLTKAVTGAQAQNPAVPATVSVTASWTEEGGTAQTSTLTLPTNGTSVPFGQNLLIGTKVTLTETPLSDGSSIAWGAPVWSGTGVEVQGTSAVVTIGRNAEASVTLENHAATSTAGISLIKGIAGAAKDEVDPSTEFPVTATWRDADEQLQSRNLLINAVEPTPLGVQLPAGTVVTLTEGTSPAFPTVVWGSVVISGDGVTSTGERTATVVVSDQQSATTLVTVTNEANWAPGTFSVAKTVTGVSLNDADVPPTVSVLATWWEGDERHSESFDVPTDGTVTEFPTMIPHGTEVTLTEAGLDDNERFTWAVPTWSGEKVVASEDGSAVVTIGAATVAEVGLENTAIPSLGSIVLTKSLTGEGAGASASTAFPVTLTWTDLLGEQQTREVTITAGTPVTVGDLPLGTAVRVEEKSTTLAERVVWSSTTWSSTSDDVTLVTDQGSAVATIVVSGEPGTSAAVSLANTLGLTPKLPVTGGQLWTAGIFGGATLILGGAAILLIRRRRHTV
ncbi:MAG: LPXTG cell wall anchor domain-containing protein [Microbacterium sp.]|uniref:beta strand repeat-containing protein n=1 Tax=Microbacterium sp. TaxID=51671 RepID=UPI001ACCCA5E|nr:DUF5979 domain-containing protein [Microbacterium sp.]MBN9176823.1 LPXTG cell wall anchor domain-containing protein [Microbacterium sp.]